VRSGAQILVAAPPHSVWEVISDPTRQLSYMSGITRWEIAGDQSTGLGARYRMLLRVGSAEVGGLIELVEFAPPREIAWTSVTGVDQRGRWRLREVPGGRTKVELRLAYGIAGSGLGGWVAEHVAARTVSAHLHRTVEQLRRLVEAEQVRARAAARRTGQRA
jgi:uncharacterized membrane protein